jgi:hypothetical protein
MLEQAIVDAAALREAALKNAEQAIIDKFAPQIKEAVDSLLENEPKFKKGDVVKYEGNYAKVTTESDNGRVGISLVGEEKTHLVMESELEESSEEALLQEEEVLGGSTESTTTSYEAPLGAVDLSPDQPVDLTMELEFDPAMFQVDLEQLEVSETEEANSDTGLLGGLGDLGGDDKTAEAPGDEGEEDELALQEIMNIIDEIDSEEVLEEELIVDMAGQDKNGSFETNQGTLKYQQEMELARMEADKYKEENEALIKRIDELDESFKRSQNQTNEFKQIIEKMDEVLEETLLSNAKLLYSNQTLSDASLNERQKNKIVEAIAKAKTPDEAKNLQETLSATVGTSKSFKPKSLSESIQRRSVLSGAIARKNKPSQELSFAERMKKLAGID